MTSPIARDEFDRVLAEKLWTLVPQTYRDGDAEGTNPGALRALIEIIAEQAAHLRRSHDRLWDDQMIELCADWAVPYIGALVGTRVLPASAARGARIDVAKTIYYRKRKGTPAILEQLISDIAGWDGVVAEGFRRLARLPHGLDAPRDAREWAAMAPMGDPLVTARAGGPFDALQHLADINAPVGRRGRFGINRVTLHLFRLRAYPLRAVRPRPHPLEADCYTFDPSGRDVPLFAVRGRSGADGSELDWDGWRPAQAWDVPAPIPCRLLGEEVFELTPATQLALQDDGLTDTQTDELTPLFGRRLRGVSALRTALLTRPSSAVFLAGGALTVIRETAIVEECGKRQLIPRSISVELDGAEAMAFEATRAGSLADWADPRMTSGLIIDPERGRLRFPSGTPGGLLTTDHFTGHADKIGAGGFARGRVLPAAPAAIVSDGAAINAAALPQTGALRIDDSASYGQPNNRSGIVDMDLHAADGARPYIELTGNWSLRAHPAGNARLLMDGLWIGAPGGALLRLIGDWEEVRLTNMTLDPGGALSEEPASATLGGVELRVLGRVETLIVERSILNRVAVGINGQIEDLRLSDSIVQDPDALAPLRDTNITLDRSTVLGNLGGRQIDISNSLITGTVDPRDTQNGCARFSAAPPDAHLPRPYRCATIAPGTTLFRATRFGNPDFARLRAHGPAAIREGGEGDAEMGAFHSLNDAARLAGLKTKVAEYAPFGILPIYQFET
jgi:hypothetical protein